MRRAGLRGLGAVDARRGWAVALWAMLCLSSPMAASAQAIAPPSADVAATPYLAARAGDVLQVRIDRLHPTQTAIGYDEVYYKLGRYRDDARQKFDDYCEDNGQRGVKEFDAQRSRLAAPSTFACKQAAPRAGDETARKLKTVVIGPAGVLYLTDGHHTVSTLRAQPDGGPGTRLHVRVTDNFSALSTQAFWARMGAERKAWLKDKDGQDISPATLPAEVSLGSLTDDPYRSLVYFARGIGYQPPRDAPEFLEFYWATWLRKTALPQLARYDLDDTRSYARAVGDIARKMVVLGNDDDIANGATAASLGKLARFDPDGELKKLTRDASRNKPAGKLVYAVDYKRSLRVGCTANCR